MLSLLHISDLHRDPTNPLTNDALLQSLLRDREHFAEETPPIRNPDLVIVSGDLVAGVSPTARDAENDLEKQYAEAERFLAALTDEFVSGQRDRVVIVPGNHDVSYPAVHESLKQVDLRPSDPELGEVIAEYVGRLGLPGSSLRWSWNTLRFFEIVDASRYAQRLAAFARFYDRFYKGSRSYSLETAKQFDVFDYPQLGVTLAAFNSCHNNDPLNRVGCIHPDCIAGVHRALGESQYVGRTRIAVWHHSTAGGPSESDYMDRDTLQVLMDCHFLLGLHGHQHKPQVIEEASQFGVDSKIIVISAGTLCGGRAALPMGHMRSYNLIEIDLACRCGMLHLRQMQNANVASPIWGPGRVPSSRKSHISFTLRMGRPAGIERLLAQAEEHLSRKRPSEALALTAAHIQTNELARRLHLEGLAMVGDNESIARLFFPPRGVTEIVYVANALAEGSDHARLRELLGTPEVRTGMDPALREIRDKYAYLVRP